MTGPRTQPSAIASTFPLTSNTRPVMSADSADANHVAIGAIHRGDRISRCSSVSGAGPSPSVSGIYGNPGQTNYGAAKAGIAAFTNIAALELARYGVTVNAVAPVALTRMTEGLGPAPETDEEREMRSPRWIAPIVTWLASAESKDVTGRVFEASGNVLAIAEGWVRGPRQAPLEDPTALGPVVRELLGKARLNSGMDGEPGGWPQPPSAAAFSRSERDPGRSRLDRRPQS